MKYEITEGEYAYFLNTLESQATAFRAIHGGRDYFSGRGTIRLDGTTYIAGVPSRPANWISWNDALAFADWAGLRPVTELEFTKASRGPGTPIAHEYPWGTATTAGRTSTGHARRAAPRHIRGNQRRPRGPQRQCGRDAS